MATKASLSIRDFSRHVSLYLIGYNPVTTRKMLSRHKLALKDEKWVVTVLEAGRNIVSVAIHLN